MVRIGNTRSDIQIFAKCVGFVRPSKSTRIFPSKKNQPIGFSNGNTLHFLLCANWPYNLHKSRLRVFNAYGSYIQRILQTNFWGKSSWSVHYSNTEYLSDKLAANKLIQSDNLHIWFPHRTGLRTDISSWLQRVTWGSEGDCKPGWGKSQGSYYSRGCKVGQPSVERGLKGNPIRVEGQQPRILGLLRLLLIKLSFHCLHAEKECSIRKWSEEIRIR